MLHNSNNKFLGFVPALVADYLFNKFKARQKLVLPEKQSFNSVVMFADISGFTNLTEKLSKRGAEGAELIAFALNRYMELLVNAIGRSGGDIFKFAGDAMIVLWPPPKDDSETDLITLCRQAIQSALDIQARLNDTNVIEDIKLSVKIGFGIGEVTILHVGGVFSRAEYLAAGEPLLQAFEAEHCANSGGVIIISNQVWNKINRYFEFRPVKKENDGHHSNNGPFYYVEKLRKGQNVQMKADALLITNQLKPSDIEALIPIVTPYIPAAVVPYLELNQEKWSAELRRLTVMFLNLGIDLSDAKSEPGLKRIQVVIETVQKCVYKYQGSLNKLLMDDKGSTLIVVFGLPPMAHQDDPVRATLTAIDLIKELKKIDCACSIGVTTGLVFAGVVGTSGNRREYSILGDSVNLAARLMQAACGEKQKKIFVDETTRREAQCKLAFRFVKKAMVKGKSKEISFFEPIPFDDEELNNFPYSVRTHNYTPLKGEIINNEALLMVGKERDAILKRTMEIIEKFIKKPSHNLMFLFSGMLGIGKSLMLRNIVYRTLPILEKTSWKNSENCEIFVTSLNCATRERKYNGWLEIIKKVMRLLSLREKKSYESLVNMLLKDESDLLECYSVLEKVLELTLQRNSVLKSSRKLTPLGSKNMVGKEDEIIKKFLLELFKKFTEDEPITHINNSEKIPFNETFEAMLEKQEKKHTRINNRPEIYPPFIIVLDDMQDLDVFSWKIIKKLLKNCNKILILGAVRTEFLELKPIFSKKKKSFDTEDDNKNNEEIIEDGIFELEESLDNNVFHKIPINEIDKEDLEGLMRKTMNFGSFEFEETSESNKFKDPLKWFVEFLANKTKCVPLFVINLLENLREQNYILFNESQHTLKIKSFLVKCIEINEELTVIPPLGCNKINGPIIDHLACHEIILLKVASVIGENFDFRNLVHINPLKKYYDNDKLLLLLDDLVKNEFLEILDENNGNIKYRMTYCFMRESLYQRMIFAQRRQIHRYVAEALQEAKPIKGHEVVDNLDCERLIYHWSLNENLNPGEDGDIFKLGTNFSSKAKRSIVVKKISSILSRNQRDFNVTLIKGKLEKKSDKGVTWSLRYCVLNTKELKYYYTEEDCKENPDEPLGSISLKHIYNIMPLDERVYKRENAFIIYTGSWWKKHKERGIRNFYFSALTIDELEEWKTYIEFVRAKAIYDEFVNTFGKISFPLTANVQEDLEYTKTSYKEGENMKYNYANFTESSLARQTSHLPKLSFSRKTRKTIEIKDTLSIQSQIQNKAKALKQKMNAYLNCAFISFFSHLMQISFNARMGVDREDADLTLGKTNQFLKFHAKLFEKLLEEKEIEEDPLEEKESPVTFQDRIPNIKRKHSKFHSHVVSEIKEIRKSSLRRQKTGSLSASNQNEEITANNNDNTNEQIISPLPHKESPVQKYIKRVTNDINIRNSFGSELEEEKNSSNDSLIRSMNINTIFSNNNNNKLNKTNTSNNSGKEILDMSFSPFKGILLSSKKNTTPKSNEEKSLKEFKVYESKKIQNSLCIPQKPFQEITIEYNAENEEIPPNETINQYLLARYEGLNSNLNYSLKPQKKSQKSQEIINDDSKKTTKSYQPQLEQQNNSDFFEYIGFALINTSSLPVNNTEMHSKIEIKKGEPVSLRNYSLDQNLIECKYYEKIGVFKKNDFYYWANNIPKIRTKEKDEDISHAISGEGPLKPKSFVRSKR